MKYDATLIRPEHRSIVGEALGERLEQQGSIVACLAVARQHAHILCKMPPSQTWTWIGNAKRHAWYQWRDLAGSRKLWAKKGRCGPIDDRPHQLNVYDYILRQESEGGCVWRYSDSH